MKEKAKILYYELGNVIEQHNKNVDFLDLLGVLELLKQQISFYTLSDYNSRPNEPLKFVKLKGVNND
jgi:hypothetical protein